MTKKNHYTLGELVELLNVELRGDSACVISGIASLTQAVSGQLGFLSNSRFSSDLISTRASAVIVDADNASSSPCSCLISRNPYVTYAKASQLFALYTQETREIHPSASIHGDVSIAANVGIGPNATIDRGATIGQGTGIGAGTYIGINARIGKDCAIAANVSILHDVCIGDNAIIHPAVVIGGDGFGFAFDGQTRIKIEQLGTVKIGPDVEIGAGSTIDRGALEDTIIEQGVKIDDQVHIAHNCVIGAHSVLCGCTGIAGSTTIGKHCQIGGGVGILGQLKIVDRVNVTAMSLISQSIDKPGYYSTGTGQQETHAWKRSIVRFRELDDMAKRIRRLEKSRSND